MKFDKVIGCAGPDGTFHRLGFFSVAAGLEFLAKRNNQTIKLNVEKDICYMIQRAAVVRIQLTLVVDP